MEKTLKVRRMTRQSFFHNVFGGAITAIVCLVFVGGLKFFGAFGANTQTPSQRAQTAAHEEDVRRHESWERARNAVHARLRDLARQQQQNNFVSAVQGHYNPWQLDDWRMRTLAYDLRVLGPESHASAAERANAIHDLASREKNSPIYHLQTDTDSHRFVGDASFMNDPHAIQDLWMQPVVNSEMIRAQLEREPSIRPAAYVKSRSFSWWTWFLIAQFAFAFGYTGTGYVLVNVARNAKWKEEDLPGDPLIHAPQFALGWLILLIALPGMLVCKLAELSLRDRAEWRIQKQREVVSLLEQLRQKITARMEQARAKKDEEAVSQARQLLVRVGELEGMENKDKIRADLEDIALTLDSINEANRAAKRGAKT